MTLILVVDDEPLYQRLLQINLEHESYEVLTASNGEEALEVFTNEKPDLVHHGYHDAKTGWSGNL